MNEATRHLIARSFAEVVDDLLTGIVGGVVNEEIIFDAASDYYPLAQPASQVRALTGTGRSGRHPFQQGIDFVFLPPPDNAVLWQLGADHPDDGTIFYVDYFVPDSRSPLTDLNVGSVTRTLGEAMAREIATVYREIERAYLSGFVDTADGASLDLVVAILGISRRTKESAAGTVTFFRDPAVQGDVTIPAATELVSAGPDARFVTTELRTLQRGQVRIDVPVRAAEGFAGDKGLVPAGRITATSRPIAGIARVANAEPTTLGGGDETDDQLRPRAKAALRSAGKATVAALISAVAGERADVSEVWDPNGPVGKTSAPGTVALLVEAEPARLPAVRAAVEVTRAAGVLATVVGRYVFIRPRLAIEAPPGTSPDGLTRLVQDVIDAATGYVQGLASGKPAVAGDLLAAVGKVPGVQHPRFLDVSTARADLGQPGPQTLVDALMAAVASTPASEPETLRSQFSAIVATGAPTPTAKRVPDRSLVRSPSGGPATDAQVEAGEFIVVSDLPGGPWFVVLDMQPADVVVNAAGAA